MKKYFLNVFCFILFIIFFNFCSTQDSNAEVGTTASLTSATSTDVINILLVPGHEPTRGGAEYKTLKERDMTVRVAEAIAKEFKNNPKYKVVVARDFYAWHPILANYFKTQSAEIKNFIKTHAEIMNAAVKSGLVTKVNNVYHNKADSEAATHLFGLNKLVSDQKADAVIHIHYNDYPGRRAGRPGKETGFAIYIPEKQYKNATSSALLAKAIFPFINKYLATSTLPQESSGIIEDQDLIAIGSNNTLTKPSVLIEYGYIYENKYSTRSSREKYYQYFGQATALGIKKFFEDNLETVLDYRKQI